ncbi:hypothetical protein [Aureliella helgolandensis]|uniref:Uncharacterized protein n=1 Tax=Aureliella helgolandensis TaxID=2527968 RepID=A0A518GH57_9BACT|nr:hypothetical protein [Aureliella helgolandensis]QDV27926.1 hypothetical protein Q31a_63190 [Aureliella helgolandensis]
MQEHDRTTANLVPYLPPLTESGVETLAAQIARWQAVRRYSAAGFLLLSLASVSGTAASMILSFRRLADAGNVYPRQLSEDLFFSLGIGFACMPFITVAILVYVIAIIKLSIARRAAKAYEQIE